MIMSNHTPIESLLQQEFEAVLKTLLESVRDETGGVLGKARGDIEHVLREIKGSSVALDTVAGKIQTTIDAIRAATAAIDSFKARIQSYEGRLGQIEQALQSAQGRLDNVTSAVGRAQSSVERCETQMLQRLAEAQSKTSASMWTVFYALVGLVVVQFTGLVILGVKLRGR